MTTYILSIIGISASAIALYWLAGWLADYFD
jgi:hypothetical protein